MSLEEDIETLYYSLFEEKDLKLKENNIYNIIEKYNLEGRLSLRKKYECLYKENYLVEDLKNNLYGNFSEIVSYLFIDPYTYDCYEIFKSLEDINNDYNIIFEIITSRPNFYLQKIINTFQQLYKKELEKVLKEKFDPIIGNCISILIKTKRDKNKVPNYERAKTKAKRLINTKLEEWLKNSEIFSNVFAKSSPEELIMIGRIYYEVSHKDLIESIQKGLKEKEGQFLIQVVFNSCHPYELFAIKLNEALCGNGIDTNTINRILITRNEVDIDLIRDIYKSIYNKDLTLEIQDKIFGMYQKVILDLINRL